MIQRLTPAVRRALALIGQPKPGGGFYTPYAAARETGIALSTIYRAIARQKLALTDKAKI